MTNGKVTTEKAVAVSVAEMNTREEVLFGSFRMVYKVDLGVGAKGGSIAGFFAYFVSKVEEMVGRRGEMLTKGRGRMIPRRAILRW